VREHLVDCRSDSRLRLFSRFSHGEYDNDALSGGEDASSEFVIIRAINIEIKGATVFKFGPY